MSEANYLVEITDKNVACLSEQLIRILNTIEPFIRNAVWYASDVDADRTPPDILKYRGYMPKKVGTRADLIRLCQLVDQFLSGVFLALSEDRGELLDGKYGTENKDFRDMGEAFLEIRAFDTAYFKIYANDFEIIKVIANEFYGIPQYNLNKK